MKHRYRLTRSAKRNLQAISGYWIEKTSQAAALGVLTAIIETIITLSGQPGAGVGAPQFGVGVRKFPSGNYMIYYRESSAGIDVLHVFHGARDQKKAWREN